MASSSPPFSLRLLIKVAHHTCAGCDSIAEILTDENDVSYGFPEGLGEQMKVCEDPPRFGPFFREL